MRCLVMILPLLVMAAASSAAAPSINENRARCPKPATVPEKAAFKRLGELPPAGAFYAVLRSDDDCRGRLVQARDRLGTFPKPRR